ncbi:MAG: 3-dehydroquinate dehydratase [Christensenellaceae bacterium]|nr:3-dehydroquinate dehydratase [Christensenellaceae bacterium]MDD6926832.1 3-dehydroquinate dehydratase [bacterium]MDY2850880.1 type II 3-dehydroquinate dehydratase [Christensenellaceae bacterium]
MKLLVINGPNLNMLGKREKSVYGEKSYKELLAYIKGTSKEFKVKTCVKQYNGEGEIVTAIQKALGKYDGVIINAGAYTHTSIAIPDALRCLSVPVAEVHLSDINNREEYRKHSYISETASFFVCGKGFEGYREAILFFVHNGEKL